MLEKDYLIQHSVKLVLCLDHTVPVIAVHNKDEALCVLEVVPPEWPDLLTETRGPSSIT